LNAKQFHNGTITSRAADFRAKNELEAQNQG
jgi:hypothetical protein